MATWTDVRTLALSLPGTTERPAYGTPAWRVNDKLFVWDRPLRRGDREVLGPAAPEGPIVGFYVDGLSEKEATIAERPDLFFTIPHMDGYPIVLGLLDDIPSRLLEQVIIESWLLRAPHRLAQEYLGSRP